MIGVKGVIHQINKFALLFPEGSGVNSHLNQ